MITGMKNLLLPPPRSASNGTVRWYWRQCQMLVGWWTDCCTHMLDVTTHTSLRDTTPSEELDSVRRCLLR